MILLNSEDAVSFTLPTMREMARISVHFNSLASVTNFSVIVRGGKIKSFYQ